MAPWPLAVIRPGPSSALTAQHPVAPCTYHSWLYPFVTLRPAPACPAPASPAASFHSCLLLTLYSSPLPSESLPRSCQFSFSFTEIYLHHEKQLSSKNSYLSQRSGFIFPSITLHFLLPLLHFSSLFRPRKAGLYGSHRANKLGTRAL